MNAGAAAVNQETPSKIFTPQFLSLFLTNLTFNLGLSMSNSLLGVYSLSLGASATAIGMVMSSFAISAILFRLISAPIMDTYNRKFIVICATLVMAVAFFGYSLSRNIPTLMAFRLLQGAGMAFGNACCLAMVSEILPKDRYSSGIGYFSLAQVLCQAVGPSVGLALIGVMGYKGIYILTSGVMLLSALMASRIKLNFKRTKKLKLAFNNIIAKEAIFPAVTMLVLGSGGSAIGSFLLIFARSQGVTNNIGLYFTVSAVATLITRPVIGKITDRLGLVKTAIPALCCNVIAFIIISRSTALWGFLLAALIMACGQSACMPAIQALSMKAVPSDKRGAASSTNYIGMDLGGLVGSPIAGMVAQTFGYTAMWRIMIIPFFLGMILLILKRKTVTRIEEDFAAQKTAT